MAARNFIKKTSRKIYRFLRHPRRRRESRFHNWVAERVFDRALWRPCERTVPRGMALGLFVAMIPLPLQMLIVVFAACAIRARLGMRINIPAGVVGAWVTNPITILPILTAQLRTGEWLWSIAPFSFVGVPPFFEKPRALVVGCLIFAVGSAIIGYLVTLLLWDRIAARILSPEILRKTIEAARHVPHPKLKRPARKADRPS